jgi:hypothetical protein
MTTIIPPELKATAGQLARKLKKINLSPSIVTKLPRKQRVTEKKFLQPLDPTGLVQSLEKDFQPLGLTVKSSGNYDDTYVELSKIKTSRALPGFDDPLTVRIRREEGSTIIAIGRMKWNEKLLTQKVGSLIFLPVSFSRSSGLMQDKMLDLIWQSVNSYVSSTGRTIEEVVMEGHGQAIEPKLFGGRRQELAVFGSRLQSTIDGAARNIAITGEPGIGKSSLLRKFEDLAKDRKCLTVRREFDPTITDVKELANFVLEAFRAEAYSSLSRKTETWDKTKDFFRRRSISVTGPGVGSLSVGAPTEASTYVLQESFFKESMRLWSQLRRNGVKAVAFLFDEAIQIQKVEGGWRFLKSVFTRIAEAGGRFMLVVAGEINFSDDESSSSSNNLFVSPMERYLQPLRLKEMTRSEIGEVLDKTVNPKECPVSPEAVDLIFDLGGGNPYLVQNILLTTVGQNLHSEEITARMVELAFGRGSRNLEEIFSERLEKRSEDEKGILFLLSSFNEPVNLRQLQVKGRLSEKVAISRTMNSLIQSGLVRVSSDGKLKIFSPLFRSFLAELNSKENQKREHVAEQRKRSAKKRATPK